MFTEADWDAKDRRRVRAIKLTDAELIVKMRKLAGEFSVLNQEGLRRLGYSVDKEGLRLRINSLFSNGDLIVVARYERDA